MEETVTESRKISPSLVFLLVHPLQVGIGILSYQPFIVRNAGYDGWISMILGGLGASLVIWLTYMILNKGNGSIVTIHRDLFGKWLGGMLSFVLIIYFILTSVTVLRTYIQIVQVWMFPELTTWLASLMFLALIYYAVIGGFRTVVGVCFFGFFVPFLGIFPVFPSLLAFVDFSSLLPIGSHSPIDILKGVKESTLAFIGFEALLMAYPFIQKPRTSQKWAHFSNLFTLLIYLWITLLTFGFFSQKQLMHFIWPTLSMLKIVEFPFMQRFEYFSICLWLLTILPNIVVGIWAASRGAKVLSGLKQKYILPVLLAMALVITLFFQTSYELETMRFVMNLAGFYLLYLYLPFLWVMQMIITKVRKKNS